MDKKTLIIFIVVSTLIATSYSFTNNPTLTFYALIGAAVVTFRNKFKIETKVKLLGKNVPIIMLLPIKGMKNIITSFSEKHMTIGKIIGWTSVPTMFGLIALGLYMFINIAFITLTQTQSFIASEGSTLIVMLPGIGIPLLSGWAILLFSMFIHELFHAWVGISYGYKVKESGIGLMLIFPLAYVKFANESRWFKRIPANYNKFITAGCFANFLAFLVFLGLYNINPFPSLAQTLSLAAFLNFILALVNMMPLGITDGAMVFNSVVQKFVSNHKTQGKVNNIITYIFLSLYLLPILIIVFFKFFMPFMVNFL
jgi:hypothetical protein